MQEKGRIDSEDLELASRNVKRVTRWADPVETITSFAEVVCDNYEALVDENRKRAADEDGVSKRANTRSRRRAEQVQPTAQREVGETSENPSGTTQPAQMEINDAMIWPTKSLRKFSESLPNLAETFFGRNSGIS
jgi:hypothetical protein